MSRNRPGYENNHSSRSLDHQQKHKKRKAAEKTNENHENHKRKRYPSSRQEGCAMSSRHKEKSLYVSNEEQSFTSSEHEEDSASVPKQTSLKLLDLKKVTKEKSLLSSRYKSRSLVSSKYDEPSRRSSRREEYSEESQGYKDNSHAPSRSKESSPESSRYEEYHRSSYSNKYSHASSSHKTNFHLSSNNKENSPTSSRQRKSPIPSVESRSKLKKSDDIAFRTGGAYIPPAKLKAMQERITDKGSAEYQKISWEALKKSITGLTNKVNISNISELVRELFKENIIRGKGILVRSLMQSQAASPTFTHVYAALAAVINTKFPSIIELLLKRLICQFKRGFRRNNKQACVSSARFIAHLVNQQAAHEILALEILSVLLENPTSDSIEVAIAMLKECGMKLVELTAKGVDAIFGRLHDVLHDGEIDKRVQYMIEVMYAIRKDKFKDFEAVVKELDLVEESDKFTHLLTLDEAVDPQEILNVFKFDPEYEENEKRFKDISKEILEGDSDGAESDDSDVEMDSEEENEEELGTENQEVIDMTETNLVVLRRKIYLTIQSSLDFEECAHKLLKFELQPGQVVEMCYMILDCCAQQRTYEKFYGLLAQRFCQLNKIYMEPFTDIFKNSYETIHRLETNKLRNVAKFFAHLLYTDAIPWSVLADVKLNEDETTSSSRIFIKILFQELCEYMGLTKLNERVKDVTLQEAFDGLFPRNKPHYTRFAINFFTSIGLGGLTDELREHLKSIPKNVVLHNITESKPPGDDSSDEDLVKSPSNNSSTTSTSSSSSDDSESDDSEQDDSHEKKRRNKHSKKRQSVNSRRKVDTEHSKQKLKSRRKHKKGS